MKQKVIAAIKGNGIFLCLSIVLPITIMAAIYYSIGIYPGSKTTILASDALSQYAVFHASFNNVLHGEQSAFYTWYGSLGLNFWALSAYYLNGIFTPIVYFFDNQAMPDALYMITLLKFGAIGGAFWFFSSQTYKIAKPLHVGLSVAYALMSYTTAYSEVIMWLDAFIYLPLILLGIHRLMDFKKPALLFISYLLLFLSNFYMAFMIGIFSFLYFFARLFTNRKRYSSRVISYLITSILAGGASMVTILPTILDLKNNGEGLNRVNRLFTADVELWDLVTKNMVGVYDTSKYKSAPFIYIGLLALIFFFYYFVSKKIPLKNKLLYGSLGVIVAGSFYIDPLNLFWQGMHAPNMFLFRYSFLLSCLIILLAGYALEVFTKDDFEKLVNISIGLLLIFLAAIFFTNKQRYDYLSSGSIILTFVFLLLYLLLFYCYQKEWKLKWLPIILTVLILAETSFNAQRMIAGIRTDWGYPAREYFDKYYPDIKKLVDQTKVENEQLYRLENMDSVSRNDSFLYGYSGVTMFSSIRNRNSSAYLHQLGFRSFGSNLNISYLNNTLLMDAMLGIKYNISKEKLSKYGFDKKSKSGEYTLYENKYALPLGVLTDEKIYEKNAVANQTALLTHMAGEKEKLFQFVDTKQVGMENLVEEQENGAYIYSEIEPTEENIIEWSVDVPANSQAYFSITPTDFGYMDKTEIELTIEGVSRKSNMVDGGQYHDLGYHKEAKTVNIKAVFRDNDKTKIKIFKPDVVVLDIPKFEEVINKIQKKGVDFKTTGRKAKASVELTEDQVILTTIPFDKGWTAYVDGKRTEIPTFKDAFLTLRVPKGKHTVEFVFLPQGFKLGLGLFISCSLIFLLYTLIDSRNNKRQVVQKVEVGSEGLKNGETK
ncbi:hypothetical protein A5821_002690 [Enterococcus sp. 7F3_DIV0205]|uniref:ABC transporter permease n=1 Tax=Candidatus Enterococcus palustris TaxID=1834189 RepID=A0AAQ3WDU9_9ENTE|nr:YfhO family protein [Enterococcus sp. 7F3_DIV0205]OTN83123.1 hypothetical protein A5821_003046 [Enterococcus sp. 7F3_DIV0205]